MEKQESKSDFIQIFSDIVRVIVAILIISILFCSCEKEICYYEDLNYPEHSESFEIDSTYIGGSSWDNSRGRCQARTQDGTQCKRTFSGGGYYCWQHK